MTLKQLIFETNMKKEVIVSEAKISRTNFYKALRGQRKLSDIEIKKLSPVIKVSQKKLREANI